MTHPPGHGYPQPNYGGYNQGYPPPTGGYQPFNHGGYGIPTDVPGAGTALTCGIVGLILFFNIIGIVCNIIAIVRGGTAVREYNMYPGRYTESSYRKAKNGRICGIVGLCLIPTTIIIIFAALAIAGEL